MNGYMQMLKAKIANWYETKLFIISHSVALIYPLRGIGNGWMGTREYDVLYLGRNGTTLVVRVNERSHEMRALKRHKTIKTQEVG